ncbi:hypothetical protein C8R43DRAFT_1166451, partial [Mycena crocata]
APKPPSRRFQPYTPPPAAHTSASITTASISCLFPKGGRHSVSVGAPVVGIMKGARAGAGGATPTNGGASANGDGGVNGAAGGAGDKGEGTSGGDRGEGTSARSRLPPLGLPLPLTPTWASPASWGGGSPWAAAFGGGSKIGSASGGSKVGSAHASGASTPASSKRISLAELPESWASSRPAGSSTYRSSKSKSKSKAKSKSKSGKGKAREERAGIRRMGRGRERERGAGWLAWLVGGSALGLGLGAGGGQEERERDSSRVGGKGGGSMWGGGIGGGMMGRGAGDEWAV